MTALDLSAAKAAEMAAVAVTGLNARTGCASLKTDPALKTGPGSAQRSAGGGSGGCPGGSGAGGAEGEAAEAGRNGTLGLAGGALPRLPACRPATVLKDFLAGRLQGQAVAKAAEAERRALALELADAREEVDRLRGQLANFNTVAAGSPGVSVCFGEDPGMQSERQR